MRIPANFCGVYGFKPTRWRHTTRGLRIPGLFEFEELRDVDCTVGSLGNTVEDVKLLMKIFFSERAFEEDPWVVPRAFDEVEY